MAGTEEGAMKAAATRREAPPNVYFWLVDNGYFWCWHCKSFRYKDCFGKDRHRKSGYSAICKDCHNARNRARHKGVPPEERKTPGPARIPRRDGDKIQARRRINHDVEHGIRPRPDELHCVYCGHKGPDIRHNYHHHMGYAAEHHYDVVPVCTKCHAIVK